MATETTVGYTICEVGDVPDAFEGKYPGAMRLLGGPLASEQLEDELVELGPLTAVRVAPHTIRSVWNEGPEEAVLLIASTRSEDPRHDVELVEDFWPAP
jgi:hypothetical protein